jgi:hypothetical protein
MEEAYVNKKNGISAIRHGGKRTLKTLQMCTKREKA